MYRLFTGLTLVTALLWSAGPAEALPHCPPAGCQVVNLLGYSAQPLPLDSAVAMGDGIIIGTAKGVAVAYVNGQVTPLIGKTGYTNIKPSAISSNGYIVGSASSGGYVRGLFWASYANAPIDIGALGPTMMPTAINAQGVAVGWSALQGGSTVAFTWSVSGGLRSIAPPNSSASEALDISDTGYVAGYQVIATVQYATRWYPGSFGAGTTAMGALALKAMWSGTIYNYQEGWNLSDEQLAIAPCPECYVFAMSDNGRKVGHDFTAGGAFTVAPGSTSVQSLPVPSGTVTSTATAVDGCGNILGSLTYSNGTSGGVLWSKPQCDPSLI